jgi:hypothetical protein
MTMSYTYSLAFGSRPCINGDGVDDHLRVLTQSAGLNITTGAFGLAMTLWYKSTTTNWLLVRNTDSEANTRYAIRATGSGGLAFWLTGSARLSISSAVTLDSWNDIVFVRESNGTLKLYVNGVQHVTTATYATALSTALNLTVFARSNGTTGTVLSSAYMNNISIYAGSKATISAIKKHRAPLCTKYGITYA